MITVYSGKNTTYKGLSSDTKPTGCRNGDRFKEIDTGAVLIYNEAAAEWNVFYSSVDPMSNLVGSGRVGYLVI